MSNPNKVIAENIRVLMAIRQIRVGELARDSGVVRNTINSLCKGDFRMIQIRTLESVAKVLDVTPAELLTKKASYRK